MRFAAALVVLFHHLLLAIPGVVGVLALAQAGYVGVTFFFVLSGFVLTYSWTSTRMVDFYVKRAARIFPVHLLTALAMAAVLWRGGVNWPVLPVNLALAQAWSPDPAVHLSFVGASWSLSCEVFFYACFPLLYVVLSRCLHPVRWAFGIVGVALGAGLLLSGGRPVVGEYLYHLPLFRLTDFAVGILLCLAVRRGWRVRVRPTAWVMLVVVGYVSVLSVQSLMHSGAEKSWLNSLVMVLPFGLLIASVAGREIDGGDSLVRSRAAVALGQWSFALYMVHGVVLAALFDHVHDLQGAAAIVVAGAIVALVVTLSWLMYALYERPVESAVRRRWLARRHSQLGVPRVPSERGGTLAAPRQAPGPSA